MGALNIPSAADVERLTRRLRSVSQRMEGIEEAVDRLDQRLAAMSPRALRGSTTAWRAVEAQLGKLVIEISHLASALDAGPPPPPREQERLKVDEPPAAPKRKPAKRKVRQRGEIPTPPRGSARSASSRGRHAPELATSARSSASGSMPRRSPSPRARTRRATPCRAATANTRRRGEVERDAPPRPSAPAHDVGRDDGADDARRCRPPAGRRPARGRRAARRRRPARGSCRPRASTDSAMTSEPGSASTSAVHVPARTSRRAPSAISSSTTIAVLGPPRPVLWMVSGAPSAATPV